MRLLNTFFPRRSRPRTVIHAGPLLLRRDDATRALRRFLRMPRSREVFLVHHGQEPLRSVAKEAGVADIAVDAATSQEANATAEMALALGARRLDFTLDEPGVQGPDGAVLPEVTVSEAEQMARDPKLRPRVRTKLRAGCDALRKGVERVRFGDPSSLASGDATVLIEDPAVSQQMLGGRGPEVGAASAEAEDFWRLPPLEAMPRKLAPGREKPSTQGSLRDPWSRLRGRRHARPRAVTRAA